MDKVILHLTDDKVSKLYDKIKETNEQKYLDQCRQRLDKIISTKIRTTFIGAIDQIQQTFGFLWKDGLDCDLNEDEIKMRQLFDQLRTNILNIGNRELRAAKNEIANQTISWNRYHTEFKVLPTNEGDGRG